MSKHLNPVCEPQHHDWRVENVSPDDRDFDLGCFTCGSEIHVRRVVPPTTRPLAISMPRPVPKPSSAKKPRGRGKASGDN